MTPAAPMSAAAGMSAVAQTASALKTAAAEVMIPMAMVIAISAKNCHVRPVVPKIPRAVTIIVAGSHHSETAAQREHQKSSTTDGTNPKDQSPFSAIMQWGLHLGVNCDQGLSVGFTGVGAGLSMVSGAGGGQGGVGPRVDEYGCTGPSSELFML